MARKTRLVSVLSTTAAAGTAVGLYVIPTHTTAKTPTELVARTVQAPTYGSLDDRIPAPAVKLPAASKPAQAVLTAAPTTLVVRSGDTLSALAATVGRTWQAFAAYNRLADANFITVGQVLKVPPAGYVGNYSPVVHYSSAPTYPAYTASSSYNPSSGFEACVIARESGGNAQVMNGSGHWGLYQFSYSTWVANGGAPGDWGHAGPAEQHAVFARSAPSNWTPYDGC